MKKQILLVLLCAMAFSIGCKNDAREIWRKGIQKCAQNDLLGPNVVYLGPSSRFAPGTIFQKFADGGLQVSHLPSSYLTVTNAVQDGQTFTCAADSRVESSLSAKIDLSKVLSSEAAASGKLNRAKSIKVTTDSLQWVELITGPYRTIVNAIPETNQLKDDLLRNNHLVLSRALRVQGMKAELEFSTEVGAEVRAELPKNIGGLAGTGISLATEWEGNTKLKLTSNSDFFIAGELRHYRQGGLAAAQIGELAPNADKLVIRHSNQ